MATFTKSLAASREKPSKLTVVLGEPALREHLVDQFAELARAGDAELLRISAASTPHEEIWASTVQYPLDSDSTVFVIIRDAERLELDRFVEWAKGARHAPKLHVVLVLGWRYWRKEKSGDFVFAEAREFFTGSSSVLFADCSFPSTPDARFKAQYEALEVMFEGGFGGNSLGLTQSECGLLINHCHGDFDVAVNAARIVTVFKSKRPIQLTPERLEVIVPRPPSDRFVSSVLKLRKKEAMEAAMRVGGDGTLVTVGRLCEQLSRAEQIHRARSATRGRDQARLMSSVVNATQLQQNAVREHWDTSKHYDEVSSARRWRALYRADEELMRGVPGHLRYSASPGDDRGIFVTLVAEWMS